MRWVPCAWSVCGPSSVSCGEIEFLEDHQLMVEHALDLRGRQRVLFVDASLRCAPPFEALALRASADASLLSHALSPQALLQVYRELHGEDAPPCTLLAIRGEQFELGAPPSRAALAHLDAALVWARAWLARPVDPLAPGRRLEPLRSGAGCG